MAKYRVLIICVYLGKQFPWYFSFFLKSCCYNSAIDFLILTNINSTNISFPPNVKSLKISFEEFNNLASNKLGFKINISQGYKLNDFKPLYGLLFEALISSYDMWGHCDLDIIFGDINEFIAESNFRQYDVLSVRPEYISGFFALYKNNKAVTTLFKKSSDYKKILQSSEYFGFDECGLVCDELAEGKKLEDLASKCKSMTHIVKHLAHNEKIKSYFDLHVIESVPGDLIWDKGKLYYNQAYEVMLYHLVSFKVHPRLKVPRWNKIPDKFYIHEFSFSKSPKRNAG